MEEVPLFPPPEKRTEEEEETVTIDEEEEEPSTRREEARVTTLYPRPSEFLSSRGAQSSLRWTLVFTILFAALTYFGLGIAIAYGVPYWPAAGSYGYGYLLGLLNFTPIWVLYLAVGTYKNVLLNQVSLGFCGVQWLVNLIVTLIQIGGGISGHLNLNAAVNSYPLAWCIGTLVFQSVLLFTLLYLVLGAGGWLPRYLYDPENVFELKSSLTALRWTLIFALILGLWALLCLVAALMLGIPAWPVSTYNYGYALGTLNYFLWLLFLATAIMRVHDLIKWSLFCSLLALVVNIVVFALQLVGLISSVISLTTSNGIFGLLASAGPMLFTVVLFGCLCYLVIVIAPLTTTTRTSKRDQPPVPLAPLVEQRGGYYFPATSMGSLDRNPRTWGHHHRHRHHHKRE